MYERDFRAILCWCRTAGQGTSSRAVLSSPQVIGVVRLYFRANLCHTGWMDRSADGRRGRLGAPTPVPAAIENRSTKAPVVTAYCADPQCRKEFRRTAGRGRPRIYCSDACRRSAENAARRISAQLQHHREMAQMLERDLAAFDSSASPKSTPEPSSVAGLDTAVARAEGVLLGLSDGSVLASEFTRLLDAVRAAQPSQQQHRAG